MAVRVADNLKTANDSTEFPVAYGEDIWIDKNKGSGTANYSSIQDMFDNDELGGGSTTQVDTMPLASAETLGQVLQFIGATGTYTHNYFYECVSDGETPPTYSWVQKNVQPSNATAAEVSYDNTTSELEATNVQGAVDEVVAGLGTAAGKDFTDTVRPNSHDLVESGSVYSAINNALSAIYTPRGDLDCSDLTAALLIEENVGSVYQMNDSGYTSSLFINGAGIQISTGDNVGIIKAGADTYLFNYMGSAFDLHAYQKQELETPLTIDGTSQTTVEGALGGLNVGLGKKVNVFGGKKSDWDLLSVAEKTQYDATAFTDDEGGGTSIFPDWAKAQPILNISNYEVSAPGWVVGTATASPGTQPVLSVNGVTIAKAVHVTNNYLCYLSVQVIVDTGDVFAVTSGLTSQEFSFVPFKS